MKISRILFQAFALLTMGQLLNMAMCADSYADGKLAESLDETFRLLHLSDRMQQGATYCKYNILDDIKSKVSSVRLKYAGAENLLSTLDVLLKIKLKQLQYNGNNTEHISLDLTRLSRGLDLLQAKDENIKNFYAVPVSMPPNVTTEAQIIAFASQDLSRKLADKTFTISGKNSDPDLKKILRTGSFVMLMLSTTADVCALSGWGPCVVLYVVGSGGVLIWFTQILREVFGSECVSFMEVITN